VTDDAMLTECGDRSSLFAVSTGSVNVRHDIIAVRAPLFVVSASPVQVTLNIITRGFDDKGVTV
jgi:hypothetical protein